MKNRDRLLSICICTGLCIFLAAFLIGYIAASRTVKGHRTEMKPGTYEAYSVHKMFNPRTGEPVYWVIAATLKEKEVLADSNIVAPVNQGDFRFYEVSRARVVNLPDSTEADPEFYYRGKIIVR